MWADSCAFFFLTEKLIINLPLNIWKRKMKFIKLKKLGKTYSGTLKSEFQLSSLLDNALLPCFNWESTGHPETRTVQVTAAAFLFTQVSKITLHSLWKWREEPHMFQLRQLHRPWRRADLRLPARLCGRTVRGFVLPLFGENLIQMLFRKRPEGNSQSPGRNTHKAAV